MEGTVRSVSPKGYGFIRVYDDDSGWYADYFFHFRALVNPLPEPTFGDAVDFILDDSPNRPGDMEASQVRLTKRRLPGKSASKAVSEP